MKKNTSINNAVLEPSGDFDFAKSRTRTKMNTKEMALCGLMGGLCSVLMMFRFPLPFMPPFMDFDFAGMVEMIGGFTMGPVAAFAIILVKILLKCVTQGTSSAWTGELSNLILSCSFVIPAVLIYGRHKTKKMAIIGMLTGTVICAAVAVLTNLYMIIPFYATFSGLTMDKIIAMCEAVNPFLNSKWRMALLGIVPFNLIKNGVLSVLTMLVYKKLSRQIKHFIQY
ncbi:MAG: ECF transporter S component [Clostridium sp.]